VISSMETYLTAVGLIAALVLLLYVIYRWPHK
jgi:hypothetical protein